LSVKSNVVTLSLCLLIISAPAFADEATETEGLPETFAASAERGKAQFQAICAHCHTTTYEESRIGAPGLKGVLERHSETWLNQWLKSPEEFAQKDVAARDLIDANTFGLAMPTLPAMQDEHNRLDIIEYLKTLKE